MAGKVNSGTHSGEGWQRQTTGNYGLFTNGRSSRRIICEGAGDVYLVALGGSAGAGTLFFTAAVAGQQFDIQCDGIGTSTTCSAVIALF